MDWFKKKFEQAAPAIARGARGVVEAVNPFDAESRGNKLIDQTQRTYGGTNEFKSILDHTNPYVNRKQPNIGNALTQGKAAGTYQPEHPSNDILNSRMWIKEDGRDPQETLRHEGLHAAWDREPENSRATFLEAAQTALPPARSSSILYRDPAMRQPDARTWLRDRTGNYSAAQGLDYADLGTIDPRMQTELHSYLPEYYDQTKVPMPTSLQAYYSRFYTPGRNEQRRQLASDIFRQGLRTDTYNMSDMSGRRIPYRDYN